jgi:hypothetical protein
VCVERERERGGGLGGKGEICSCREGEGEITEMFVVVGLITRVPSASVDG